MQDAETIGWVALRAVYAWMFLYPAVGLVKDWPTTIETTRLVYKRATALFALGGVLVMVLGGVMILLGAYGRWAGLALVVFNLGGARIHYRLAETASRNTLSADASATDRTVVEGLRSLATVGHVTSAQKNYVLAAVGLFFFLVGTGPLSLAPGREIFSP